MQRLRLLPKFALASLVFLLPLLLASGLLVAELHKSVSFTAQERQGLAYIRQLHELRRQLQERRSLEHMRLAANQQLDPGSPAAAAGAALESLRRFAVSPLAGLEPQGELEQGWQQLQQAQAGMNARASFAAHSKLIAATDRLATLAADRARLSLDPEVRTVYLSASFLRTFPDLAENLSVISGRGAAYIDSGLFEAGEDQVLTATAMLARHELERLPGQYQAILAGNPALRDALGPRLQPACKPRRHCKRCPPALPKRSTSCWPNAPRRTACAAMAWQAWCCWRCCWPAGWARASTSRSRVISAC